MASLDDDTEIVPDGLTIRRWRRRHGWSRRTFVARLRAHSEEVTGLPETIPRSLLQGVEDENERIPYGTLCLIASGLDCNPVEILLDP
ncbi:MAG: hypothetical protein OEP95_03675 [Myxococcales bacterium]|nr:hypothetical protein [Myxococcales bacterium]